MKTDGFGSRPDGPYEERFKDGTFAAEGFVAGGRKHGHWRYYLTPGGLKAEGDYDHDGFAGPRVWFRANSVKMQDGPWTRWRENGQVWDEGRYAIGRKVGVWRTYDPDGRLRAEKAFKP